MLDDDHLLVHPDGNISVVSINRGHNIVIKTLLLLSSIITILLTIAIALLALFVVGQAHDMISGFFLSTFIPCAGLFLILYACTFFVCWLDSEHFSTATEKAFIAIEQSVATVTLFALGVEVAGLILQSGRDLMA